MGAITISICFRSFEFSPDLIDDLVGVAPDVAQSSGDLTPGGRVSRYSYWSKELFHGDVSIIEDAWISAMAILRNLNADGIRTVSRGAESYLLIQTSSSVVESGFYFDAEDLRFISDISLDISIDCS